MCNSCQVFLYTGWNDKIVVLKKTTLLLYFKTFIEKNQFSQFDYVVELTSIQCSCLQSQSPPRSGTGIMPFLQAPVEAWWILGRWHQSGWLWCCERSCWWCSRCMTKQSSPAGSGQWRRGWQWEKGTKS